MTEVDFESRRTELLQFARQTRIKWVLDSRELEYQASNHEHENENETQRTVPETLKEKIPGSECIQNMLNYLTDIIDDGEFCSVSSIAASLVDYDDYDDEQAHSLAQARQANPNKIDSYNEFVEMLILPAATEIVKSMQQFVLKFCAEFQAAKMNPSAAIRTTGNDTPLEEEEESLSWSSRIWTFLDHIQEKINECTIWKQDNTAQKSMTRAHTEKFVFKKVHRVIFASDAEDTSLNAGTAERIRAFSFLRAEHLDIKCIEALYQLYLKKRRLNHVSGGHAGASATARVNMDQYQHATTASTAEFSLNQEHEFLTVLLDQPIQSLKELEVALCPQDMLACVKRCTMAIAALLKECRSDGTLPGADELLPMMIYALKCCTPAPSNLHSILKYLQRYTNPSLLIAEAGYLLTNFVSAVFFLDNVDARALTIEPEEFDRAIMQAKMQAKSENDSILHQLHDPARKSAVSNNRGETSRRRRNVNEEEDPMEEVDVDVDRMLNEYKKSVAINNRTEFVGIAEVRQRRNYK